MSEVFLESAGDFAGNYPDAPARLKFRLSSPLMTRMRLVTLANTLPKGGVEFNPGDLPIAIEDGKIPAATLSAEETIRRIGECNSWMVLRKVEHDPEYAALAHKAVDLVADLVTPKSGDLLRRENFIFISSPGAVTPLHIDPEHNILIHLEGEKTVTVFSQHDRDVADQTTFERLLANGERNVPLDPKFESRGRTFAMKPGDGLYIPPLAPHWVKVTGNEPSLSFSVTWRSNRILRDIYCHQINHRLRAKGGSPAFPGENPVTDQIKVWRAAPGERLKALVGVGRG